MAYENIELVVAAITGDIYMTRTKDDGAMDTNNRRIATNDVMQQQNGLFQMENSCSFWWSWNVSLGSSKEGLTPQEVKAHIDQLKE